MRDQIELRARIDGIPEVVHAADLLHPGWGTFDARPAVHSVRVGAPLPSLAEYYRGGLRLVIEPGSAFAYSNHGFATLGQLVEDVSGMPLERYFRERLRAPRHGRQRPRPFQGDEQPDRPADRTGPGQADRARSRRDRERRPAGGHGRRPARAAAQPRGTGRGHHGADLCPRLVAPPRARAAAGQPDRADGGPAHLRGSDPGRRLRQIAAETAERKARTRTSLGTLFRGRIARRLLLKAVMRQRVNVTSASIPGAEMPLYLAGTRVLEVFPVLPLIANEPLGVGALSYAGTFNIGVVADRDTFPDLDVFAAGVREELHALDDDARSSPKPLVKAEGRW